MQQPDSLRIAVLLTAVVAFGPISTDLYLPSLPGIARHFGTDAAAAQATLSVFLFGFAGGQILYGPLSDRFGRRPVLVIGIAVYLAASMACAIAESIQALVISRFFQAMGACSGVVLARAIVRDLYAPERAGTSDASIAQLVPSGPEQVDDTVQSLLVSGCFMARRRVLVVTPYFIPDASLLMALTLAARRGVLIDIVLPRRSNHRGSGSSRTCSMPRPWSSTTSSPWSAPPTSTCAASSSTTS